MCVCTISKDIGRNKEKEICLPNKESISGHTYERTNMAAKCETNTAKNCKIFEAVNLRLHGHYTQVCRVCVKFPMLLT